MYIVHEVYHKMLACVLLVISLRLLSCSHVLFSLHKLFALKSLVLFAFFSSLLLTLLLATAYVQYGRHQIRCKVCARIPYMEKCNYAWQISTCSSLVNNLQFNPLEISILLDFRPDNLFDATYIYAMFDLVIYTLPPHDTLVCSESFYLFKFDPFFISCVLKI